MPKDRILIYGANGYTGTKLVSKLEKSASKLQLVAAGRSLNRRASVGQKSSVEAREFALGDAAVLSRALRDVQLVVNTAGPFAHTALPLALACIRANAHYIDVSGEVSTFRELRHRDDIARKYDVSLTPGVGVSVLISTSLAAYAWNKLRKAILDKDGDAPDAPHVIRFAFSRLAQMSRGSARTVLESVREGVLVRRHGSPELTRAGTLQRDFDFEDGQRRRCTAMNMPEPIALATSTGLNAPNIESYVEADAVEDLLVQLSSELAVGLRSRSFRALGNRLLDLWPSIPESTLTEAQQQIVVEVEDRYQRQAHAVLVTNNAYDVTVDAVVHLVEAMFGPGANPKRGFVLPQLPDFVEKLALNSRQGLLPVRLRGI